MPHVDEQHPSPQQTWPQRIWGFQKNQQQRQPWGYTVWSNVLRWSAAVAQMMIDAATRNQVRAITKVAFLIISCPGLAQVLKIVFFFFLFVWQGNEWQVIGSYVLRIYSKTQTLLLPFSYFSSPHVIAKDSRCLFPLASTVYQTVMNQLQLPILTFS